MKKYKFTLELTKEELKQYDSEDAKQWTFKRMFNKADIIKALDEDIKEQEKLYDDLSAKGKEMEAAIHTVKKRMYETIKGNVNIRTIFPFPKTGEWSYQLTIYDDEIIRLEALHEYGADTWEGIGGVLPEDPDSVYLLDEAKPKYISTNEYAKLHKVEPVTVRQWIRRGKLRKVKFINGAWSISEMALPSTERGYESRYYINLKDNFVVSDEYKLLEDFDKLYITQNKNNKKKYILEIDYKNGSSKEIEVDSVLKEKIEHLLISSDNVEAK